MTDIVKRANNFDQRIRELVISDARKKNILRWLALSLTVDITLTIILGFVTFRTIHNSSLIVKQNRNSIVLACQTTNKSSSANLRLWNYLFTLPNTSPQPMTDAQKNAQAKQLTAFKVYINDVFKQEKC